MVLPETTPPSLLYLIGQQSFDGNLTHSEDREVYITGNSNLLQPEIQSRLIILEVGSRHQNEACGNRWTWNKMEAKFRFCIETYA